MSNDIETLLRDTLHDEADAAVPWGAGTGGDPWARVDRAHRHGRMRRRAGLAGVLAAAAAVTGAFVAQPQDRAPAPAGPPPRSDWRELDDGRTRGSAPDAATREKVAEVLGTSCCETDGYRFRGDPSAIRFLWNGRLGERRAALVRATLTSSTPDDRSDKVTVVRESAPGRWEHADQWDEGSAVVSLPYVDAQGGFRELVIVRRGSQVATSQPAIRADGSLEPRRWTPVPVRDGVVDLRLRDPRLFPGTEVRVEKPGTPTDYLSPQGAGLAAFGLREPKVTAEVVAAATAGARGDLTAPGVATLVEMALGAGVSDVEHSTPAILWAGRDGRGENVVVSSSGFPGQGRVLRVRGSGKDSEVLWTHYATVPATPVHGVSEPVTWRVPVPDHEPHPTGHVVGWLLQDGATVTRVDVAGEQRAVQTADGLGTVEAGPRDNVRLRGRLADGSTFDSTIRPGDADPVDDLEGLDLFPPGPAGDLS